MYVPISQEKRTCVRVYILGPAVLATSSQALSVFLAVWRRGGGPRYNCACELTRASCRSVNWFGWVVGSTHNGCASL